PFDAGGFAVGGVEAGGVVFDPGEVLPPLPPDDGGTAAWVAVAPYSNAPMSHAPTRLAPRWSLLAQPEPPASIAGRPAALARVNVGPPLSASATSFGSA